ncbi:hypothetical protein [Streptomyces sp. NBC_01092]|uniref:hypothetical protein n=1 Tax=Streptomyces sp. NBC_01092 TaxID=2903748 RepID=UPI003865079A|nr:hypothetical protein OG254_04225 [Streptomyces sp. NBC_01092]
MYIALAPFTLKPDVTEETLLTTSDAFESSVVQSQDGIHRRILVRAAGGGYAGLVFFREQEAMERVMEAEQNSDACTAFFSIMDDDGTARVFKVLKSYE